MTQEKHKKEKTCLIAVIGGGAAGLAAAITAAREIQALSETEKEEIRKRCGLGHQLSVVLLEKNDRVGKKILATGNGRCNLSNAQIDIKRYHGSQPDFARGALFRMNQEQTIDWFRQMGLLVKTEADGRVFPYSLQAAAVLEILRLEASRLQIDIKTQFDVASIQQETPLFIGNQPLKQAGGFLISSQDGRKQSAMQVILASGGKAAPASGSDGSGYALYTPFGHKKKPTFPAIVQLKTDTNWSGGLAGSKFEGRIAIVEHNKILQQEEGEILFTKYGLSGPPVLQISRLVAEAKLNNRLNSIQIQLNFLPDWRNDMVIAWLFERRHYDPDLSLTDFLTGLLPKKIGQVILKQTLGLSLASNCGQLADHALLKLAEALKQTYLSVTGTLGWDQAQVTAGGLDVTQFDPVSLASQLQSGLFAAGEVLDIDGDCGGFNLQWAWSSGCQAGKSAVKAALS